MGPRCRGAEVSGADVSGAEVSWGRDVVGPRLFRAETSLKQQEYQLMNYFSILINKLPITRVPFYTCRTKFNDLKLS